MYLDEQIIEQRMEAQHLRAIALKSTATINGEEYIFSCRTLFENQIEMLLPESFEPLSAQAIQSKYMTAQPPKLVFSNETGSLCFALDYSDYELFPEDAKNTLSQMKAAIKRVNPAYVFENQKSLETIDKSELNYFEFKSYALDTDLYNLMFLCAIHEKMFLGSFHCPYDEHKEWGDYLKKILGSLRPIDKV